MIVVNGHRCEVEEQPRLPHGRVRVHEQLRCVDCGAVGIDEDMSAALGRADDLRVRSCPNHSMENS